MSRVAAGLAVMTAGERMVWAAEFVRARADQSANEAAVSASSAVWAMRELADRAEDNAEHKAMLEDMLSNGADR